MCSAPPVCCGGCKPPPCCSPAFQMPVEQLRPSKRHYCCSTTSECELCSLYPKNQLCSSYFHNKFIVDSLSCLFRINHFQVLATLFRLACDDIKPVWRYPRDRVWSVMENVKSPYTELLDLTIYHSMHDRCGHPIDPLDRANISKLMRLIFMVPVLVPEQRDRVLAMLQVLSSRAICPVNLAALLMILGNLSLFQLVFDILEQDKRLLRFRVAREFWELSYQVQDETPTNSPVVSKRRRKKIMKNIKNINGQKKQPVKSPRHSPPIFCNRRVRETELAVEVSGRSEDRVEAASRRSSAASRRSSTQRTPSTQTRWKAPSVTRSGPLHPYSIPVLGMRSLHLSW